MSRLTPERAALVVLLRYVAVSTKPGDEADPSRWHQWASDLSGSEFFPDVNLATVEAALAQLESLPKRVRPTREHTTVSRFGEHFSECDTCQDDPNGLCPEGHALAVAIRLRKTPNRPLWTTVTDTDEAQ